MNKNIVYIGTHKVEFIPSSLRDGESYVTVQLPKNLESLELSAVIHMAEDHAANLRMSVAEAVPVQILFVDAGEYAQALQQYGFNQLDTQDGTTNSTTYEKKL